MPFGHVIWLSRCASFAIAALGVMATFAAMPVVAASQIAVSTSSHTVAVRNDGTLWA